MNEIVIDNLTELHEKLIQEVIEEHKEEKFAETLFPLDHQNRKARRRIAALMQKEFRKQTKSVRYLMHKQSGLSRNTRTYFFLPNNA